MKVERRRSAMSLIVIVEGREAVPVRAIAFLTDWRELQPESLARQLSDDDEVGLPGALVAHRLHSAGHVDAIPARWWIEKRREIQAISEDIRAVQAGHESGRQRWRREATHVLPAGVFVWKSELDDFVSRMIAYQQLGPAGVPSEHSRGEDAGDDHPGSPWAKERAALSRQIEARYRLDYEALVLPELQVVIGEGFEADPIAFREGFLCTRIGSTVWDCWRRPETEPLL
ncbi:hypothetical protein APR51_23090 [Variovorax paradoxus]|jgi:hypothetical protein|nr:hypothetical protein APR51_23090 [Variovorax paradoxus]